MKRFAFSLATAAASGALALLPVAADAALVTFTASTAQTAITGSFDLDTLTRTFVNVDLRFVGTVATLGGGSTVPFDYTIDQIQAGSASFKQPFTGNALNFPYFGDEANVTSSGPTPATRVIVAADSLKQLISIPDSLLPDGLDFTGAIQTFIGTTQFLTWTQVFLDGTSTALGSGGLLTGASFNVSAASTTPNDPGTAIPEPSSAALAALGLLAAALRSRAGRAARA